jgi:hypothetical protein
MSKKWVGIMAIIILIGITPFAVLSNVTEDDNQISLRHEGVPLIIGVCCQIIIYLTLILKQRTCRFKQWR